MRYFISKFTTFFISQGLFDNHSNWSLPIISIADVSTLPLLYLLKTWKSESTKFGSQQKENAS